MWDIVAGVFCHPKVYLFIPRAIPGTAIGFVSFHCGKIVVHSVILHASKNVSMHRLWTTGMLTISRKNIKSLYWKTKATYVLFRFRIRMRIMNIFACREVYTGSSGKWRKLHPTWVVNCKNCFKRYGMAVIACQIFVFTGWMGKGIKHNWFFCSLSAL